MFQTSNFLYSSIEQIDHQFKLIEEFYPSVWESVTYNYQNPTTGNTEYVQINYVSNMTGSTYSGLSITESGSTISDISLPFFNHYDSGGTMYSAGTIDVHRLLSLEKRGLNK